VNIIQNAWSAVCAEKRTRITANDVTRALTDGRFVKRYGVSLNSNPRIGVVNGLAVCGATGCVIAVEAVATKGKTGLSVRGVAREEELKGGASSLRRRGSALEAAENVLEVLEQLTDFNKEDYHISINFPGGSVADGPSAGVAMLLAVYSAVFNVPVAGDIALTGELSLRGEVLPVGGVAQKVRAAFASGAKRVYVPKANAEVEGVVAVATASDVLDIVRGEAEVRRAV
jgi:Lon-like ATP-dependent protease